MALGINGIRTGCEFPLWMQYALIIYMISFIVLFGNFYAKQYLAKGKQNWKLYCDKKVSASDANNNVSKPTFAVAKKVQ